MPDQEIAFLEDPAVLWPLVSYDEYGQPVVGNPQQIYIKWEMKRRQWTDPRGNEITLDGVAFVAQKIRSGSRMWLGLIDEWVGTAFIGTGTSPDDEIMQVAYCNEVEDIKGRAVARVVGLMRLRATESGS